MRHQPDRRYTRYKLSTYQLRMLAALDVGREAWAGVTFDSLCRKGLITPTGGPVSSGKLARATLTPEGAAALRDAREAGWGRV